MNNNHLQQIFSNYIEKFEEINNSVHREYYKWQIAKQFKGMMDDALNGPITEFAFKLKELKKLSSNLIDSYTQPFGGLAIFAEKEPETVREMFKNLYTDDGGDYCYLLENGVIAKRYITCGLAGADMTEVTEGLIGGEQVITDAMTDEKIGKSAQGK